MTFSLLYLDFQDLSYRPKLRPVEEVDQQITTTFWLVLGFFLYELNGCSLDVWLVGTHELHLLRHNKLIKLFKLNYNKTYYDHVLFTVEQINIVSQIWQKVWSRI